MSAPPDARENPRRIRKNARCDPPRHRATARQPDAHLRNRMNGVVSPTALHTVARDEREASARTRSASATLPHSSVAVGKTPDEPAESLLRVGSKIGHLMRRARSVRPDAVAPGRSDTDFRAHEAPFRRRLFPTATSRSSSVRLRSSSSSVARVSGARAETLARWREAAMVDVRLRCAGRQLQGVALRASAVG
jgi:hypothetical protein